MFEEKSFSGRKKNIFIYGNHSGAGESDGNTGDAHSFGIERIYPKLVSKKIDYFSFLDCNFRRKQEQTARYVVYSEFGIANSFTVEASLCGASAMSASKKHCHFNTRDLEKMGEALCSTLLDYEDHSKIAALAKELSAERKSGGRSLHLGADSDTDEGSGSDENLGRGGLGAGDGESGDLFSEDEGGGKQPGVVGGLPGKNSNAAKRSSAGGRKGKKKAKGKRRSSVGGSEQGGGKEG